MDLVVVAMPAKVMPQVLEEAEKGGVKAAVIISGDFTEMGMWSWRRRWPKYVGGST